jgi:hypothetical protein
MPAYRLPGEENVYAVTVRPGSTVKSRMEGDLIISEVVWASHQETITTSVIMPIDVAVSWLESLQLPELAKWTRTGWPDEI